MLTKNNKKLLVSISVLTVPTLVFAANTYNVLIDKSTNDYILKKDFLDTGVVQCDTVSPLSSDVYKGTSFDQNYQDCQKEQKSGDGTTQWVAIDDYTLTNQMGELLLNNCSEILNQNHSKGDGVYAITNNTNELDVLCDMTTNGGGWTLVSYAGRIDTNKKVTTGNTAAGTWLPLFFNFGSYDTTSLSSKNSFSRFDLFKDNSSNGDEIMARRTSVQSNMIIFPIQDKSWYGRDVSEGHFAINSGNRNLDYLKLTNTGNAGWKTVSNDTDWFVFNGGHGSDTYPGMDWNMPEGNNEHTGNDFNTRLSHRVLLYWESSDTEDKYVNQWFHGQPLQMEDPGEPTNAVQDVEFWYRKL